MRCSYILHVAQRIKYLHGYRIFIFNLVPWEVSSVQISAVRTFVRIILISIIVCLSYLITAVQNRDSALCQQVSMKHEITGNGLVDLVCICLVLAGLKA